MFAEAVPFQGQTAFSAPASPSKQDSLRERHKLASSLRGQRVHIPNLQELFQSWPQAVNPLMPALREDVRRMLINTFPLGKRRSKLEIADPALFGAMWWPYASFERLQIATYLSIWLFAWDDETDSCELSELAKNLEETQSFRATTVDSIRMHLVLDCKTAPRATDFDRKASRHSILDLFAPVGRSMIKHCSLEQRKALMLQIEFFLNMSELERRVQLNEHLPSVESYQRRRMGSSAVGVCLAIHEYALDISLPEHVIDSQTMKSLWNETNVIISICNDILSLKKEVAQGQVDTLLPLLYIAKDGNIQAAMSDAVGMLENAVGRFNLAANDLLEGSSGDQTVTTNVAKFIDSCRYACTANLNWSLHSGRYGLRVKSLYDGITLSI